MFGKIKNRLKDVFKSSEEYVEENSDKVEEIEHPIENSNIEEVKGDNDLEIKENHILPDLDEEEIKENEPKKKGFLGRIFGSKNDEREVSELEHIEDEMLEDVSESEKEAIKSHHDLTESEIEENKKEIEREEIVEENLEKETMADISDSGEMEEISKELEQKTDEKNLDNFKETGHNVSEVIEKVRDNISDDLQDDESDFENVKGVIENEELDNKTNVQVKEEKSGFFGKLKAKTISPEDFDNIWVELQMFLLEINIAFEIVEKIERKLKTELVGKSFNRFKLTQKIREVLEQEVEDVMKSHEASFLEKINSYSGDEPIKILVLGVNGTGKTTTIAKIVKFLQNHNKSVVVAAADTFRAAAVEQLEEHSKALDFKLIMHKGGSDPAAVAYDAIEHAKAKKKDIVLIDTAGRMPNNSNLMMELEKVKRVSKADMAIFVGDSVAGNDLVDQINLFNKGVKVDGAILTKVDTDERPGSVVTTAYSISNPIYFLGVGQGYDDLVEFDSREIAKKLFELD